MVLALHQIIALAPRKIGAPLRVALHAVFFNNLNGDLMNGVHAQLRKALEVLGHVMSSV
jgi:hypothetical protein